MIIMLIRAPPKISNEMGGPPVSGKNPTRVPPVPNLLNYTILEVRKGVAKTQFCDPLFALFHVVQCVLIFIGDFLF